MNPNHDTGRKPSLAVLGAGFIGLNFVRYATKAGLKVHVLDRSPPPPDVAGKVEWTTGELAQRDDVARALDGVDTVFHLVSSTVPGDQVDIALELKENVFQTLQLLDMCVERGIRRLIFSSSAAVYGIQSTLPIAESASTDPISAHGIHKLTIEKYLQLYRHQHKLDCKILRLSNPFGPGQAIHGRQGFIAIAIGNIVSGQPIRIRGDGNDVRDFIYIDDVCQALLRAALTESQESLFNIGSGVGTSLNGVVAQMNELIGSSLNVEHTPSRFVDIPKSILDISRARRVLNLDMPRSLRQGLKQTLAHHGVPQVL